MQTVPPLGKSASLPKEYVGRLVLPTLIVEKTLIATTIQILIHAFPINAPTKTMPNALEAHAKQITSVPSLHYLPTDSAQPIFTARY